MPGPKKANISLGRSLIKEKKGNRVASTKNQEGFRHTCELQDGSDWGKLNLQSVTEQTNIEDFLETAELAGTEFTAEKENIKVISTGDAASHIQTSNEKSLIKNAQEQYKNLVRIPRRPKWDVTTTAAQLIEMEKTAFLEWRKALADLREKEHIILTPYEKNLEFWRQLWRVVEQSDVVVQILDARDPLVFRCEDFECYVKEINPAKINILLLNKADLLKDSQREAWLKYFKEQNIGCIFFSALLTENEDRIDTENKLTPENDIRVDSLSSQEALKEHRILNREELIAYFKSIPLLKCSKSSFRTIGMVGYPNVGKSSTINSLFATKKVSVSTTPGKTKHFQTLNLSDNLRLCDCPGLVFPSFVTTKADMLVNGILPIDHMTSCLPPVSVVAQLIPRKVFEDTYGIMLSLTSKEARYATTEEVLNAHGYARGFMTQRGLPDVSRSARIILKDFVNGKLLYCKAPPGINQEHFHIFPEDNRVSNKLTPAQKKLLKQDKSISKDLEDAFFKKVNLHVHVKLKGGKLDTDLGAVNPDKPWRKHNNKNKHEKLRRVYSKLDNL